ncbi:MAG: biopolymer transporter ExbD [Terrimonas sp.]|uniref:ExbD/TolR family protein n=1 Tax=Terrimonas sp. TaxID=1914338 RepID=UPI00092ADBEF|nr:biopolymer transporter ExbD [Terrimonas sp.]MBN8788309.1 biopolymer transporter ExbD [Terrimonas sp.]OJY81520.1 MAG: biopolymer transporter ExbD [Sphingobacteriales bacterium 40-81]PVD50051.1 biopolymer transporter ExbD [Terrimonas sp.]
MASIDEGGGGGGHKKGPGVKKAKKLSTRVDMTPMVDLGFLLITFFIFSTTMAQPTAMKLLMPKDTDKQEEQTKVKASGALTIMLGKADGIYYYEGDDPTKIQATDYKKIRDVVINKKKTTKPEDFVVVIKPNDEANYANVVAVLDEMSINEVKKYAMVPISPVENEILVATEKANGIQ